MLMSRKKSHNDGKIIMDDSVRPLGVLPTLLFRYLKKTINSKKNHNRKRG